MAAAVVNSSLKLGFHENEDSKSNEYYFNISRDYPQKIQAPFMTIEFVINILLIPTCILGIVGNGTVAWLLGFRMKRTPFTTYILNLAAADIGVLLVSMLIFINTAYDLIIAFLYHEAVSSLKYYIFRYPHSLLYNTDQFLLTAISVDRCVVVLFPVWHQCHRRPHLSRTICVFIWVLSFLLSGLDILLMFTNQITLLQSTLNIVICAPLMAISAITLFVTICLKSQQPKRGKLFMTIFLALFFFLIFGFPMNYLSVLMYYCVLNGFDLDSMFSELLGGSELSPTEIPMVSCMAHQITVTTMVVFVCTVLNCSVNPLIYFLVGRDKKSRSGLSMKVALQRIFKNEENSREEERPQPENQV